MSKKDTKISESTPLLHDDAASAAPGSSSQSSTGALRDAFSAAVDTTIFFQTRHEGQFENDENDPPPPYSFYPPPPPQESTSYAEAFQTVDRSYKDVPFAVLFFSCVAGFVYLAVSAFRHIAKDQYYLISLYADPSQPSNHFFALVLLLPVLCAVLGLVCAYASPYHFMMAALLSVPIGCLSTALIALNHGSLPGMVFSVLTSFVAFLIVSKYSARIKFSAVILKIVIHVMTWHPGSWFIALFGSLFTGLVFVLYTIMFSAVAVDRYQTDTKDKYSYEDAPAWKVSSESVFILAFCLFTWFYTFEVIKNVIHVTISGVYGTWYFFSKSAKCPRYPALGAFGRAVSYSFGSICMGSLVSALMRFGNKLLSVVRTNREYREAGSAVLDILVYVSSFLYKMLQFFNNFSFSYIALHGKSYVTSAYDTYHLLTVRGVMVVFSDCVIETTLNFYVWIVSLASSLVVFLVLKYVEHVDPSQYLGYMLVEFIICRMVCNVTLSTLTSGFFTLLVVLAENPSVLQKNYPEYYEQLCFYQPKLRSTLNVAVPSSPLV